MGNSLNFRDASDAYNPSEQPVLMFGGPPTFGPNSYLNQSQYDFFSTQNVRIFKKKIIPRNQLNFLLYQKLKKQFLSKAN
jgi:hypothetical protein